MKKKNKTKKQKNKRKQKKRKKKKKRFPPLKNSYFTCKLLDATRQTTRPASGRK